MYVASIFVSSISVTGIPRISRHSLRGILQLAIFEHHDSEHDGNPALLHLTFKTDYKVIFEIIVQRS